MTKNRKSIRLINLLILMILAGCAQNKSFVSDLSSTSHRIIATAHPEEPRHDCDTLVINCIDYRFAFANQEFITETLGLKGNYDHISIPGGIYNLIQPATQEIVLSKFTNSINFRLIKHVIMISHKDCGGYGGSAAFGSETAEQEYLSSDLRKARTLLLAKYPTLKIDLYIETLTPEGVDFEEVLKK
ncbi:MAG: hypothetical protein MRJ65_00960 [Candidatus Brocadiaceae bacterium]|nr:hypothetical protein [Candidatus Brocadiaceae bacterium]